jgi:hypothetical protein
LIRRWIMEVTREDARAYLVHFQERSLGLWSTLGDANTVLWTPAHGGRAGHPGDRAPVPVRRDGTPLPEAFGQCRGAAADHAGAPATLSRSDRPPGHACRPPARSGWAAAAIGAASPQVHHLRCWGVRVPPGAVAPASAASWPAHQPVDPPAGCRGQLRPGPHAAPGQRRPHAPRAAAVGGVLEAGHALAYPSRSSRGAATNTARPPDPAGDGAADVGFGLERRGLVESAGPASSTWLDGRRCHAQVAGTDSADGRP